MHSYRDQLSQGQPSRGGMGELNNIRSRQYSSKVLPSLLMRPYTAFALLLAALGETQLVGVVITTPDIITSNASSSIPSQTHISEHAPASSSPTSSQTALVVEPVKIPNPHVDPHPPPQGHIFAAAGGGGPGHACQITSHCPGGAESDAAFEAFKTLVRDVPVYCSFLSSAVCGRLEAGNGTG